MVGNDKKVFVALSGGVDSAIAAALLLKRGFDCTGVFMITGDQSRAAQASAEEVAGQLGIKLYVLDLRRDFEGIFDYFCGEYRKGRTPNPCVLCNKYIKFGKLWDFARANGGQFLATGHYARIFEHNNQWGLYEAGNASKDQSYFLSMINRDVLPYIVLPMGEHSKYQAREMALQFGLSVEERQESQEICFIPDGDYVAMLEKRYPEAVRKGDIVDGSGRVLGQHSGVHRFTIGQRRGVRVAMGKPYYVVKIDAESNTVTLGTKEEVMHSRLFATDVNWLTDEPVSAFCAKVKIRYNGKGGQATVSPQAGGVVVEFDKPNLAITPGQLAVFYVQQGQYSRVVGGGWIDSVAD